MGASLGIPASILLSQNGRSLETEAVDDLGLYQLYRLGYREIIISWYRCALGRRAIQRSASRGHHLINESASIYDTDTGVRLHIIGCGCGRHRFG